MRVRTGQGRRDFFEKEYFDKHYMLGIQMKGSAGKNFMFFLQDILETAIQMRI